MASIDDVARATGLSTATVSRALRGLTAVAPQTRARVRAAAEELGYVPSAAAASLVTGRTRTVAVVTPHAARWFFGLAIESIESALRRHGHDLLLVVVPHEGGLGGSPLNRVDAVITLWAPTTEADRRLLTRFDRPVLTMGAVVSGLPGTGIDDDAVGRLATGHLLALGHRRLCFAGAPPAAGPDGSPQARRYAGFRRALAEAGLAEAAPPLRADPSTAAGRRAEPDLSAGPDGRITGIVCASDELAIGLMHRWRDAGVTVPGDISVVGVDDHPDAAMHGLTTVAQPVAAQAEAVVDLTMAALRGELPTGTGVTLPVRLVTRTSTGPPAEA